MAQKLSKSQGNYLSTNDLSTGGDWEDSIDLLRRCAEAVDAGKIPISALDELRDIIDQRYQGDHAKSFGNRDQAFGNLPVEITYLP